MAIKGAGFTSSKLLNSKMTLDFAYTLYLILLNDDTIPNAQIKRYVQKWDRLKRMQQAWDCPLKI